MRFKNLTHLIGQEVELKRPASGKDYYEQTVPDKVIVVAEYPEAVLVRLVYPTGSYLRMISKQAMYCGDVQIRAEGTWLIGKEVLKYGKEPEYKPSNYLGRHNSARSGR